jgi:rod shape-determining protein MreB and related proteins
MFRRRRLGMKIGRTNIVIAERGEVLVDEPSVALVSQEREAAFMFGSSSFGLWRIPEYHAWVLPLQEDRFDRYRFAIEPMLEYFIDEAISRLHLLLRPVVVVATPHYQNNEHSEILTNAISKWRVHKVSLVSGILASAIGTELSTGIIVDIGGAATEAAIIANRLIVATSSCETGGFALDQVIVEYAKRNFDLLIGERMAERAKVEIGSLVEDMARKKPMVLRGRFLQNGHPGEQNIRAGEIADLLKPPIAPIVDLINQLVKGTPPELQPHIQLYGITLTGGGALLPGIDTYLGEQTGVPVRVAPNAQHAAAIGASRMAAEMDWKQVAKRR